MQSAIPFEHLRLLRTLVVICLLCALWFKLAPDTLSHELRAFEQSYYKAHYKLFDLAVVILLYVRALLLLLLWRPMRLTAWLLVVVEAAIFGITAFSGPALLSPIDEIIGGIQAMSITAIITLLFTSGTFRAQN